jgi:glycosyltransferase involved in cell wall biosynthesis
VTVAQSTGEPIAVLTKTWPKLSETFVLREVLGLERRGYALRIYALAAPDDAESLRAAREVRAPVTWLAIRSAQDAGRCARAHLACIVGSPLRYLSTLARALLREERGRLRDFTRGAWLGHELRRARAAHLHVHFASEPAAVAEIAARLASISFSISAHAKDIWLSSAASLRRKLEAARFTVTCTEHNRAHLEAVAPGARVLRMYHGVDADHVQPLGARAPLAGRPARVLSVGRLRAKKGFGTLIEACARLRDAGLDLRTEIVGYGPERDRLGAAIVERGLRDAVALTGRLDHDEVLRRYAGADLFVLPCKVLADGDRDGIPNVLLEAMATGLPVVSTAVSGIPELISDGENGLLVAPEDPAALAAAIERLLADAGLGARQGAAAPANGRERVTDRKVDTPCPQHPAKSKYVPGGGH